MSGFPLPPPEPSTSAHWLSEEFRTELATWCAAAVGRPVRLEQHKLRAWSTVWKVYAGPRLLYAKQNCSLQNFEAALVDELSRLVPEHVVTPTAVNRERGFLLSADQGAVLGDGETDEETWSQVVRQWAQVQRAVLPHVDALASAGLSTMSATDAEEYAGARIAQLTVLPSDDPRHLSTHIARRLEAHLPVVRRWSEEVAALGLPITLNHNDLHANNVFARTSGGRDLLFFDLGDAMLTEPLSAFLIPLDVLARRSNADGNDARVEKIASAFLEMWSDMVAMTDLRRALPAALQLGRLARLESWVRTMTPMTPAELAEWGEAAPRWLETLLDDPPLR